jgi:uncharacterized protein (DUF1778 family)
MGPNNKENKENEYKAVINNYIQNLEVLSTYISGLDDMLSYQAKKFIDGNTHHETVKPVFDSLFTLIGEGDEEEKAEVIKKFDEEFPHGKIEITEDERFSLHIENGLVAKRFQRATNQLLLTIKQVPMIFSSSLINLAIYFELLATQLIQERLMKNPEAAKIQKKSLTLFQIEELGSLEEAKNFLIEQEVVDLMHNGFKSWLDYFKQKMNVDLSKIESLTEQVNEVFCRRHLFVHNGGKVNNIYLTRVSKECREGISLGEHIEIDADYFNKTLKLFKMFGIVLGLETWKRQEKSSNDRTDFLLEYIYELLLTKEWDLARVLCQFVMEDNNVPAKSKWTAHINYWLTKKEQGEFHQIEAEIEKTDLSALSSEFQLCKMALLNNYAEFFDLLEDNFPKPIGLEQLEEWPIFKEIREQDTYIDFLKEKTTSQEPVLQEI